METNQVTDTVYVSSSKTFSLSGCSPVSWTFYKHISGYSNCEFLCIGHLTSILTILSKSCFNLWRVALNGLTLFVVLCWGAGGLVCMSMCVWRPEVSLWCHFSGCWPSRFGFWGFFARTWELLIKAGWPEIKPQRSACLSLPSTVVTGEHHSAPWTVSPTLAFNFYKEFSMLLYLLK